MISEQFEVRTAAGVSEALILRPDATEALPGVLQLTDGIGFRQAHADLSRRIAERGYVVLTPNIFYRTTRPPAFTFEVDFTSERTLTRFRELTGPLTPEALAGDAMAYIDFLSAQPSVSSGPMGCVGFCYAGQFALRAAAARPDRIAVAASFHGGNLATDTDQSPHLVLPRVKARLYFGHATSDRSMTPEAVQKLEAALRTWGGTFESEVYDGALHGWMIPGGRMYHPQHAERGFAKLMELLDSTLKSPVTA
ncbi:MAG TPA: dienelactone hydrolase family protein [Spirochaetia bacterium]|nr:dienelactone hydrolase family protein [Spirochaetia bacterium]